MASLLDRLLGVNLRPGVEADERIATGTLVAALAEMERDRKSEYPHRTDPPITKADIVTNLNLDARQATELDEWIAAFQAGRFDRVRLTDCVYLGNHEEWWDKARVKRELGISSG